MVYTERSKGIYRFSAGWASWRWLSGVSSKEKQWFLGVLSNRSGYEAWMVHLARGLQDPEFLLRFERVKDPWERSRLVGQRISELRRSFRALTDEEKAELAKQAEIELKAGLKILAKEKKTVQELLELVDIPKARSEI